MKRVIISLGSNQGDRLENFRQAIAKLIGAGCVNIHCSSVYRSEPQGFVSEHEFYNMVLNCSVNLEAEELIKEVMEIETSMGRRRDGKSYSDRIIDIDLIDMDSLTIKAQELTLPHPRMHLRNFVLVPLAEIDPGWYHPQSKLSVSELIQGIGDQAHIFLVHTPVC